MKSVFKIILSSTLFALLIVSCSQEQKNAPSNSGIDTSSLQGQSGVVDE